MKKVLALVLVFLFTMSMVVSATDDITADEKEKIAFDKENKSNLNSKVAQAPVLLSKEASIKGDAFLREVDAFEVSIGKVIATYANNTKVDYISLATSSTEKERILALEELLSIYDKVTDEEKVLLDTYLEAATTVFGDEYSIKEPTFYTKAVATKAVSYNANDAVDYAHTYYDSYNTPTYPDLNGIGGDCANFVSQILHAGGYQMDTEWYITQLNTTYTSPTSIAQLDHSWDLADPSPWISAKEFNKYWEDEVSTDTYKATDFVATRLLKHSLIPVELIKLNSLKRSSRES